MCRRVTCNHCGKPTFAGCGAHIEQVLGDVPPAARCKCNEPADSSGSAPVNGASSGKTDGAK